MDAYKAGDIAKANTLASHANSVREFGQVNDIFTASNDAQKRRFCSNMALNHPRYENGC